MPAPDVLEGGRDAPLLGPVGRRRAVLAAILAGALAIGALTAQRVVESRQAAAEQERTAGVVALSVTRGALSWAQIGGDVGALRFRLAVRAHVRNDGPRTVTVSGAELGDYVARGAPAIEPGAAQDVVLERLVVCPLPPAIPPVEDATPAAAVDVATAAGPRQVDLMLPADLVTDLTEGVRRACGVLTLAESLLVVPSSAQRRGTSVIVRLDVGNLTSRPVRLRELAVQQGLRVVTRTADGDGLPLELPAAVAGARPTTLPLEVELSVASCRAIFQLTPAPPDQLSLDTLLLTVEGAAGARSAPLEADLDVPDLSGLVSDVC